MLKIAYNLKEERIWVIMLNHSDYYYTISQVSHITGLTKETTRKWEQRHQLIQPTRLENGYRQYTQSDVLRLLQIQHYIRDGATIRSAMEKTNTLPAFQPQTTHYLFKLLEYGWNCDEAAFHKILQEAHLILSINEFLHQLIIPFLHQVGDNWQNHSWFEYQETLASTIIRDFLATIRRSFPVNHERPLVLGACLPGENHEIAIEILLIQASIKGYRNFMIGSSPSVSTIEALILKLEPQVVLLSAATLKPFELFPDELLNLEKFAAQHPHIRFVIGGEGARIYTEKQPFKHLTFCNDMATIFNSY